MKLLHPVAGTAAGVSDKGWITLPQPESGAWTADEPLGKNMIMLFIRQTTTGLDRDTTGRFDGRYSLDLIVCHTISVYTVLVCLLVSCPEI